MSRVLRLQPLTPAAFASYGSVVDAPSVGERQGLDTFGTGRAGLAAKMSFSHPKPYALPLLATEMERHPWSTQTFVPLDVSRWVVMVAPDQDGAPDAERLIAFLCRGDQTVSYGINVWHHPSRLLDRPGRFAVTMWTTGVKAEDEEWATLPEPVSIQE